MTYEQPKNPDGSPLGCPCGRLYVLPSADGTLMVADAFHAVVGDPSFIAGRGYSLQQVERFFVRFGCRLHERRD